MLRPCKSSKSFGFDDISTSSNEHGDTTARDRISMLPDHLLSSILERLTLREAVRTSVLSHRWKPVYSTLTSLDLQPATMFQRPADQTQTPRWTRCFMVKFVRGVNKFLENYKGIHVTGLALVFPLGHVFTDDIDRCVRFAIRMGCEILALSLCAKNDRHPVRTGKYVLRKDVFDGGKINLKQMYLGGCVLGPNFAVQLSSLEVLVLVSLPLLDSDLLNMFSCLVNLKFLKFQTCTLPGKLPLGSLHFLKKLDVENCSGIEDIELPNLNTFQLGYVSHESITLMLKEVTDSLYFHCNSVSGSQLGEIFRYLPQHLPRVKHLFISTKSIWHKHIPESLVHFSRVTQLTLHFYKETDFDLLKMVSILKAFPSMWKFDLQMSCPKDVIQGEPSKYVHRNLELVEIRGFYGTLKQIQFAIYLLKHAIYIKQLVIKQEVKCDVAERQACDKERQNVYKKLRTFCKDGVLIVQ